MPETSAATNGTGISKRRYFFSISDGQIASLPLCIDLASVSQARQEAVKIACEHMAEDPDRFWQSSDWRLTVTDDRGLNLFSLLIFACDAPAVSGRGYNARQ